MNIGFHTNKTQRQCEDICDATIVNGRQCYSFAFDPKGDCWLFDKILDGSKPQWNESIIYTVYKICGKLKLLKYTKSIFLYFKFD